MDMAYITDGRLVPNFTLAEMTNKQAADEIKLVLTPEAVEHAQMVQELRNWYGKPLNVSSWYRTPTFNKKCGGDKNSAHLVGLATDINNIPAEFYHDFTVAWAAICMAHGKVGGVNYYKWGMHFCSDEGRFGHKTFQIRDKRWYYEDAKKRMSRV